MTTLESQTEICEQFGAELAIPADGDKLGVAMNTLDQIPLNGLRHPREGGTCGWYIWGGRAFRVTRTHFRHCA